MLFFTNRAIEPARTDEAAFSNAFQPMGTRLGRAGVTCRYDSADKPHWTLHDVHADDNDDAMLAALVGLFRGNLPVLLYIHGNNKPPAKAFERCQQLEELYPVSTLGFSWTSEGLQPDGTDLAALDPARPDTDADENSLRHVQAGNLTQGWVSRKARHYRQAKANAQDSTLALARFLRLVGVARQYANAQPLTVAVHSLGCHFLQKAIELDGVQPALASATNVLLLAACVSRDRHASWAGRINPTGQLFITFNRGDSVLAGARVADSDDIKLGAEPGDDRVQSPKARYIDFEGSNTGLGGHGYFAAPHGKKPAKASWLLFQRLFASQRDFAPGASPRTAYPVGCNESRTICYMGSATNGNLA